jgi:hypothetical protein
MSNGNLNHINISYIASSIEDFGFSANMVNRVNQATSKPLSAQQFAFRYLAQLGAVYLILPSHWDRVSVNSLKSRGSEDLLFKLKPPLSVQLRKHIITLPIKLQDHLMIFP